MIYNLAFVFVAFQGVDMSVWMFSVSDMGYTFNTPSSLVANIMLPFVFSLPVMKAF